MSLESWLNWWGNREEDVEKTKPIVWIDEERPLGRRPFEPTDRRPPKPPASPAPPPIDSRRDKVQTKPARDLLIAVKMLSRDTIDFLTFNDCGHTEEGLRDRHRTLIDLIEEIVE